MLMTRAYKLAEVDVSISLLRYSENNFQLNDIKQSISDEELQHSYRYQYRHLQQQYRLRSAFIRHEISCATDIDPLAQVFTKNAFGKPALINAHYFFNVSHSGDYLLFAGSPTIELGVDVETHWLQHDHCIWLSSLPAEQYLSTHHKKLLGNPKVTRNYWSECEAFAKCIGQGLTIPWHEYQWNFDTPKTTKITRQSTGEQFQIITQSLNAEQDFSLCWRT
jgi:phosphopantetheinyl transferase